MLGPSCHPDVHPFHVAELWMPGRMARLGDACGGLLPEQRTPAPGRRARSARQRQCRSKRGRAGGIRLAPGRAAGGSAGPGHPSPNPPTRDRLRLSRVAQLVTRLSSGGAAKRVGHALVLLFRNVATAVLVQLEQQGGCVRDQDTASYAEPVPVVNGGLCSKVWYGTRALAGRDNDHCARAQARFPASVPALARAREWPAQPRLIVPSGGTAI